MIVDSAMTRRSAIIALCISAAWGCSSGVYGHSRIYSPLSDEEDALEGAVAYDPVMAARDPEGWKSKSVTLFGVVTARNTGQKGKTDITLSVRSLEPRNLCETRSEDSCRVTVGDRAHATMHADLQLSTDDDIGKHSVGPGSLLRVIGRLNDEVHPGDGSAVLSASYYRHWPRGFYVTSAAREHMRR